MIELLGFDSNLEFKKQIRKNVPFLVLLIVFSLATAFVFPIIVLLLSWIFAGSRDSGKLVTDDSEIRQTQLNRLKGLIKIYGEVEIDKACEIMDMPKEELMVFFIENVGAGNLDLTLEGEKIITPKGSDREDVLESLDSAFKNWFEQEKTGVSKKK